MIGVTQGVMEQAVVVNGQTIVVRVESVGVRRRVVWWGYCRVAGVVVGSECLLAMVGNQRVYFAIGGGGECGWCGGCVGSDWGNFVFGDD